MVKQSPKPKVSFDKRLNRMANYFGNHYEILDDNLDVAKEVMNGTWKNGDGKGSKTFVWDNQDGTYSTQEVNTYEGRLKVVSDLLGLNEKSDYQMLERLIDSQTYLTSTKSKAKNAGGRMRADVVKDYLHGAMDAAERSQEKYKGLEDNLVKTEKKLDKSRQNSKEEKKKNKVYEKQIGDLKTEKLEKEKKLDQLGVYAGALEDSLQSEYTGHDSLSNYTSDVEDELEVAKNVGEAQREFIQTTGKEIAKERKNAAKDRKRSKLRTLVTGIAAGTAGLVLGYLAHGDIERAKSGDTYIKLDDMTGGIHAEHTINVEDNSQTNKPEEFVKIDKDQGFGEPVYDSFSTTNGNVVTTVKTVTQTGPTGFIKTSKTDKRTINVPDNVNAGSYLGEKPSLEETLDDVETPWSAPGAYPIEEIEATMSPMDSPIIKTSQVPYSSGFVYGNHVNDRNANMTDGNITFNPIDTGKSVWNHLSIWGNQLKDTEGMGYSEEAYNARGNRLVENLKAIGDILPGVNNNEANALKKEGNNWLQRGFQKVYHAVGGVGGTVIEGSDMVLGGAAEKVVNDGIGGAITHGIVNPAVDVGNLFISVPGATAQTLEGWSVDNDGKFSRKAYEGITSLLRFGGNVILHEAPIDGRYARIVTQEGKVVYLDKGQFGALAESFVAAGIDGAAAYHIYDSLKNGGSGSNPNPNPNPVDTLTGGSGTGGNVGGVY